MSSIFEVPITKEVIDLHYLLGIGRASIVMNNAFGKRNSVRLELYYRLTHGPVTISVSHAELFPEYASDSVLLQAFEDKIRKPIVKAWEEYRKKMVE